MDGPFFPHVSFSELMASISEIKTTPSGIKIAYYDKAHRYKIGKGDEALRFVPSVSTILDKSVPKNLAGWAERVAIQGVQALQARGRPIDIMGPEAVLEELKANNLRVYQQRDQAALRGTSVHAAFEELAGGKVPKLRDFTVSERGYIQAIAKWWAEFKPEVIEAELMVASWKYQFAGRMDLLAKLDGVLGVIDLKTSKAIRDTHHYQTAGYRLAVEESGYETPKFGAILRVSAEGEFEFEHAHAEPEQFLALVNSYNAQGDFERESKRRKKAA